jgi:hypothetical protein
MSTGPGRHLNPGMHVILARCNGGEAFVQTAIKIQ